MSKWTKWMRWNAAKCPHCGVYHDLTKFDYLMLPDNFITAGSFSNDSSFAVAGITLAFDF